jgi:hypothetical protein
MNKNAVRIVDEYIHEKKDSLDLSGCKLEDSSLNTLLRSLANSRSSLERITVINLRDTDITALPECIGAFFALRTLDVGNTRLTELPESVEKLVSLENLFLDNTYIVCLSKGLLHLPALRKVVVYDNIIFPFRELKKSLRKSEQEKKNKKNNMKKQKQETISPASSLVEDSVGDMVDMLNEMLLKPQPRPVIPPAKLEPQTRIADPFNDLPLQMIVGDMLVCFNIVPNKTKSSTYGRHGFCIYFFPKKP